MVDPQPRGVSSSYHGTHVAGTVGAAADNGSGVAGVNWMSRLMILRALGAGGGTSFDIAQAIRYAAGLNNSSGSVPNQRASVINLSLGGPNDSQTMASAIALALGQNVTIVAAAGNDNSSQLGFPASYPGVIAVGAIDLSGGKAPYSNSGYGVVVAPGGNTGVDFDGDGFSDGVLSTLWNQADNSPSFGFYQGTSMASPHVAGLASLMLSVNRDLNPEQIRRILQETAIDLGPPGQDFTFGYGLVDALAAVRRAGETEGGPPSPPSAPVLRLSTLYLNFGNSATEAQVSFSNGGGGTLQVSSLMVQTDLGSGWLRAQVSGSAVDVRINRQGLPDAIYTGRVRVSSNGGAAVIQVRMRVGGEGIADIGSISVLAVSPSTYETISGVVTTAEDDYKFSTPAFAAGQYLIVAGTDLDRDGFICDEGEYCGFYPVTNQPSRVAVEANRVLSGISFVVERKQLPKTAKTRPAEGFRIPPPFPQSP